jgi:hypothetical protein
MKNIGVSTLVNRNTFFAAFTLLTLSLASGASGSLSSVLAQGSGDWVIDQARQDVAADRNAGAACGGRLRAGAGDPASSASRASLRTPR